MSKRYGEFEQVNGAVANDLLDKLSSSERDRDAQQKCADALLQGSHGYPRHPRPQ